MLHHEGPQPIQPGSGLRDVSFGGSSAAKKNPAAMASLLSNYCIVVTDDYDIGTS
jgi:hypothetical protein